MLSSSLIFTVSVLSGLEVNLTHWTRRGLRGRGLGLFPMVACTADYMQSDFQKYSGKTVKEQIQNEGKKGERMLQERSGFPQFSQVLLNLADTPFLLPVSWLSCPACDAFFSFPFLA